MSLAGVASDAGSAMLRASGLSDDKEATTQLIQRYSGNPLALKLVAETIDEFFDEDIEVFLSEETPIFADIRDVLDQQFARLTTSEQEILLWLAITREATSFQELEQLLLRPIGRRHSLEAMRSLQKRSLLEKGRHGFILQNVVTEYLTDYLIEQVSQETLTGQLKLLNSHALQLAHSKEYIRQSQARLILGTIGQRLTAELGSKEAIDQNLRQLLDKLRRSTMMARSYAGGNLLNLLLEMGIDIKGYNFSHLHIRQAYLQGALLSAVNFTGADVTTAVFTDTFGTVQAIAFSPDNQMMATGTKEGEVRLWRLHDLQLQHIMPCNYATVWSIAFSPDSRTLASGNEDHKIRLWDVGSGQLRHILLGHTKAVWSVSFSPDGQMLASGGLDGTVRLWDAQSGHFDCTLEDHHDTLSATIAYSPDNQLLATLSTDYTICLWDIQTRTIRHRLAAHTGTIYALAFSLDGDTLASGSVDKTICLWHTQTGQLINKLEGHTGRVASLAFSPDGHT